MAVTPHHTGCFVPIALGLQHDREKFAKYSCKNVKYKEKYTRNRLSNIVVERLHIMPFSTVFVWYLKYEIINEKIIYER